MITGVFVSANEKPVTPLILSLLSGILILLGDFLCWFRFTGPGAWVRWRALCATGITAGMQGTQQE